ncbi:sigma-70 family RNA polymerase sigma factor [Kitasatospora sp. NPDC127116]|uniref:BACON domain-containing protein n=1 Tax=Kitasatospora sp. NPDC127116 TaxID=3345367 RepID=UPI00363703F9
MTTRTVGPTGAVGPGWSGRPGRPRWLTGPVGPAESAGAAGSADPVEQRTGAALAAYDRQVDGLFTYCLSVLCEHDAAADALREVRELARRHGARLTEPGLLRAWLFSLARYCCLRRLADGGPAVAGAGTGTGTGRAAAIGAAPDEAETDETEAEAARRRRELSSLAWPEAAGTDPEQREALELSVRHRLTPLEVAAVLGLPFERTRALLAGAEAEVARTRAALLVLGVGSCPELDRLGGAGAESWRDWVLGPALRRELVQHVLDCPTCRGTAERVVAHEAAEGAAGLSGLALLRAPVDTSGAAAVTGPLTAAVTGAATARAAAVRAADAPATAARVAAARVASPGLRFDQSGFPRHRAPDAGRGLAVRRRVVTTGVLAAVLAAPVIALWAGHRGGGGSGSAASVSAVRVDGAGRPAGQEPRPAVDGPTGSGAPGMPGLELAGAGAGAGMVADGAGADGAETLLPGFPRLTFQGSVIPVPAHGATPLDSPALVAAPAPSVDRASATGTGEPAPAGLLTVEAGEYGSRTILTLTNSGTTEIRWHAVTEAGWLRLSRDSGTLAPGQRITVIVTVDEDQAPTAHWTARIALPPSQAVVTLEGGPHNRGGSASSPADPSPSSTPAPTPTPTGSAATSPTAAPTTSSPPTSSPSPSGPPTGSPSPSGTATTAPGPDTPPPPR